jgi:transcription elongation factor GreA
MPISYLTREGFEKLQAELDELAMSVGKKLPFGCRRLWKTAELIENAEYEDAKNEQAFVEGRIKDLDLLLATARIIDEGENEQGLIQVGTTVTIQEDGNEPETYMIVGPAEANPLLGRISNESPIGRALINHKVGESVQVEAPGWGVHGSHHQDQLNERNPYPHQQTGGGYFNTKD